MDDSVVPVSEPDRRALALVNLGLLADGRFFPKPLWPVGKGCYCGDVTPRGCGVLSRFYHHAPRFELALGLVPQPVDDASLAFSSLLDIYFSEVPIRVEGVRSRALCLANRKVISMVVLDYICCETGQDQHPTRPALYVGHGDIRI